jgi:hypothetical protein
MGLSLPAFISSSPPHPCTHPPNDRTALHIVWLNAGLDDTIDSNSSANMSPVSIPHTQAPPRT